MLVAGQASRRFRFAISIGHTADAVPQTLEESVLARAGLAAPAEEAERGGGLNGQIPAGARKLAIPLLRVPHQIGHTVFTVPP